MNNPLPRWRGARRLALLLLAAVASISSGAPPAQPVGEMQFFTVRLTIGPTGFEPSRVSVPIGRVRIVVTSREGDHCFSIPALDVEKRVRPARPTEVDVSFERAGDFPFSCCVESPGTQETGLIVATPGR